jgi:hypothetical protein
MHWLLHLLTCFESYVRRLISRKRLHLRRIHRKRWFRRSNPSFLIGMMLRNVLSSIPRSSISFCEICLRKATLTSMCLDIHSRRELASTHHWNRGLEIFKLSLRNNRWSKCMLYLSRWNNFFRNFANYWMRLSLVVLIINEFQFRFCSFVSCISCNYGAMNTWTRFVMSY